MRIFLTGIFIFLWMSPAHAWSLHRDGESSLADYNRGTELYKQGKYDEAIGSLQKALLSDDSALIEKAHYNLGSAYYRAAKTVLPQNASSAKEDLQRSLEHFRTISDRDVDALDNFRTVKKVLEALEQQQKAQPSQSSLEKSSPNQNQDQNQDQNQNQKKDQSQKQTQDQKQSGQSQESKESQQSQSSQQSGQSQKSEQSEQSKQAQGSSSQKDNGQQKKEDDQQEKKGGQQAGESGEPNNGQVSPDDYNYSRSGSPSGDAAQRSQDVSRRQAQRLLEEYEQNEEPKGLLNFYRPSGKETTDNERDW